MTALKNSPRKAGPTFMTPMSDVVERFMRYVQVPSTSNPENAEVTPSDPAEHYMAALLGDELRALGCRDTTVDAHAYVTARLDASPGAKDAPALGLIAHLDTSPDAPGKCVHPHIVHYEGGDLVHGVVDGMKVVTTPESLPALADLVGQDLILSDGSTLLGADDKAGVAEICALVGRLHADPTLPHPTLCIAFVPDEEIGHGAALLDINKFGASWAYTIDGGPIGEFSWETFNAASARVNIRGVQAHPGYAKGVMVNSITVASEFMQMIPAAERPEYTADREGFYHPMGIEGSVFETTVSYIIRDHDAERFAARKRLLQDAADFLNARYGEGTVVVDIRETYRNMAETLKGLDFLKDHARAANREAGIEPFVVALRGGTDGSQLSFRGLPCPNLASGGYAYHSVREFIPLRSLELTVKMLECLVAKFA